MKYAILGRQNTSTYWTLERYTKTKIFAYLWKWLYRFWYDKTEIRELHPKEK